MSSITNNEHPENPVLTGNLIEFVEVKTEFEPELYDELDNQTTKIELDDIKEEKEEYENGNSFATSDSNSSDPLLRYSEQITDQVTGFKLNVECSNTEVTASLQNQQINIKYNDPSKKSIRNKVSQRKKYSKCYRCDHCSEKFKRRRDLNIHVFTHSGRAPLECDYCSKQLFSRPSLLAHIGKHIKKTGQCGFCYKFFDQPALEKHIQTHTRLSGFKCKFCSEAFIKFKYLKGHVCIGESYRYRCKLCDKTFAQKSGLKTHLSLHSGEKPFQCRLCDRTFAQKIYLHKHMINHGDKPFKCDQCGKAFAGKFNLRNHLVIHKKEKPFQCDQCHKSFSRRYNLKSHFIQHSGERPFECDVCDKNFPRKHELICHMQRHMGQKKYQCNFCTESFHKSRKLMDHKTTMH